MGWGSVGFAAGAASVGTLWTGVGTRSFPEPVAGPQSQIILPSRVGEPLALVEEPVVAVSIDELVPEQTIELTTPITASQPDTVVAPSVVQPNPGAALPVVPAGGQLINLNSASIAELDLLPGIGPALAERIVSERARGGRFTSLRDLQRVRGIGPRTAENLEGLVVFE